ncbi:hypothetical protein BDD21_4095 [Thiocapsa rosea]|uniref:Uncharacterized protein n=1 Tax=Thiocapsa rosea TaxID=69360 RepID=A0A495VB41_9GAMM|nr:hypothetical protein BDD21_4095 [Thiocapsa rosea]
MNDRIHGEQNAAIMSLCREITTERLWQPQSDGG